MSGAVLGTEDAETEWACVCSWDTQVGWGWSTWGQVVSWAAGPDVHTLEEHPGQGPRPGGRPLPRSTGGLPPMAGGGGGGGVVARQAALSRPRLRRAAVTDRWPCRPRAPRSGEPCTLVNALLS